MSTSRRITCAAFKGGRSDPTDEGILIGRSCPLDCHPRTRVAVRKAQEDWNRHVTNIRARVRSDHPAQYGNDVGDAEIIVATLFARDAMQRHGAHRRYRIVERSKESARGLFIA
jgi:hypothetical protein